MRRLLTNYGLDKFSEFSDALLSSLRVVNQEKILLGQETVHSYFQSGELLVVTDNEGQLTRTITPQEREFEARIVQWLSRPAAFVCAPYPTEALLPGSKANNEIASEVLSQMRFHSYLTWKL